MLYSKLYTQNLFLLKLHATYSPRYESQKLICHEVYRWVNILKLLTSCYIIIFELSYTNVKILSSFVFQI